MRFFTPDLLERFGSEDDNVAFEAHQEFELRSREYLRQLNEIAEKLPQRLRALIEQHYLHDARVISHSPFGICAWRAGKWQPRGPDSRSAANPARWPIAVVLDPSSVGHTAEGDSCPSIPMCIDRGSPPPPICWRRSISQS